MKLNKYEGFISSLKETLNSDIQIKWVEKQNQFIGLFNIGNNTYQLDFNLYGDSWSYKFYFVSYNSGIIELDTKMTNIKYESFKVLSTAKKGLIYFIDKVSPNAVVFFASNESGVKKTKASNDTLITKRQHIYQQILLNTISEYPDYSYRIDTIMDNQIYVLYKKDLIDKEHTFDNIQNIIESYIDGE
jgi:hypothetical protein